MKTGKKIIGFLLRLLLLAAVAVGSFWLGNHDILTQLFHKAEGTVVNSETDSPDLTLPGEVEMEVVTVDEVESKLEEIGELSFCEVEYHVTKGKDTTRYMLDDIPIPGTTNHIELNCTGILKVGYEISDIHVQVDTESRKIYLSLPAAKINSNQLLWDENMQSSEKNNILNPIEFSQYRTLIAEIKEEGLAQAEKNGMYKTAEKYAKNVITGFLGCFSDYTVVFL